MSKIRVTQVLEATAGGTRRHLDEIITNLPRDQFELRVVCAVRRDPRFSLDIIRFRRMGVPVTVLPMRREPNPWRDSYCIWLLRQELKSHPCDILHLHSAKAGLIGRWAAVAIPCTVVYSPHALPLLQPGAMGLASWAVERLSTWRTDVLLAVSDAEGRLAVEMGLVPQKKLKVISNPAFMGPPENWLPEPGGPRRFGFIGELRFQKSPLDFVEAARFALNAGANVQFFCPNQGPLFAQARQRVHELGMDGQFKFLSTARSLAPIYAASDILVLPSRWEGLPYALLDGYRRGQLSITSQIPVFQDLVAKLDRNLLARTGDIPHLAARILQWSTTPTARLLDLGRQAKMYVLAKHNPYNWVNQMTQLYLGAAGASQLMPNDPYGVPLSATQKGCE